MSPFVYYLTQVVPVIVFVAVPCWIAGQFVGWSIFRGGRKAALAMRKQNEALRKEIASLKDEETVETKGEAAPASAVTLKTQEPILPSAPSAAANAGQAAGLVAPVASAASQSAIAQQQSAAQQPAPVAPPAAAPPAMAQPAAAAPEEPAGSAAVDIDAEQREADEMLARIAALTGRPSAPPAAAPSTPAPVAAPPAASPVMTQESSFGDYAAAASGTEGSLGQDRPEDAILQKIIAMRNAFNNDDGSEAPAASSSSVEAQQ